MKKNINSNNKITPKTWFLVLVTAIILVAGSSLSNNSEPAKSNQTASFSQSLGFRNENLLEDHYEKHGRDMGFSSAAAYEKAAIAVVNHPSSLHKIESEDGDDIYYLEDTNEFVVVSKDGYIRTYFYPEDGKSYYNRQ